MVLHEPQICPHVIVRRDDRLWAGSGLSASVRRSMYSCRLGRSEHLAVLANISVIRGVVFTSR